MPRRRWVYDPDSGGVKIPPAVRERTTARITKYAEKHYADLYTRLGVRFRGALCYVDAFVEPAMPSRRQLRSLEETREEYLSRLRNIPTHLVRLRYFGDEDAWSLTFFAYSHERYEPCVFHDGSIHGRPEEAFDVGAVYLQPL